MYNSIYPININYRKYNPYQKDNTSNKSANDMSKSQTPQKDSYIPASNQINISQILMDFKNTILAINAPKDIQDEVNDYLNLVDRESKKDNPSKDIILSNLKNASKISDNFITNTLGKPSNVVEGWITTIFRQNINLKSNPEEINPDFLLKFPANTQNNNISVSGKQSVNSETVQNKQADETPKEEDNKTKEELKIVQLSENVQKEPASLEILNSIESADNDENIFTNKPQTPYRSAFSADSENDKKAKALYSRAKELSNSSDNLKDALNMFNEALGYLNTASNINIKAAIHFERAKIFDKYDYVDYALRDYFEASKAQDLNLKANAYYKSGLIYDEFKEFAPALDNYLSSVAYSGEADNLSAQSRVLSKISSMYARVYDVQKAHDYADLAIDSAVDSKNSDAIADTYSTIAQNYQHLGDSKKALENYKNALAEFSRTSENYEQMAYNYSQAAIVMKELGNLAKAAKLQHRANQYYQKAQLQQEQLAQAS